MKEILIPGGAAAVFVFLLGLFKGSKAYANARNALGIASFNLGRQISKIGNTRLAGLWEPIEAIACDFLLFIPEQIAAGLRADNVEKLQEHVERLDGVGSETRKAATEAKIDALIEAGPGA